jgi:TPR repeat protein
LIAAGLAGGLTFVAWSDWPALVSLWDEPKTRGDASAPAASDRAAPATGPRLIVEDRKAYINEPLLLALALDGASGHEFLLLKGLQAQFRLSAGAQLGNNSWRLSAFDLGNLFAYAPKDYVGAIDIVVDLHAASDRVLASQRMRLEWLPMAAVRPASQEDRAPASPAPATKLTLQPDELALLLRRGQGMLKLGDVAGARMVLRRAAEAGSSDAALMLASTFDPIALRELGVIGFASDLNQALSWYEQASALGSGEAKQRLDRLRRIGKR